MPRAQATHRVCRRNDFSQEARKILCDQRRPIPRLPGSRNIQTRLAYILHSRFYPTQIRLLLKSPRPFKTEKSTGINFPVRRITFTRSRFIEQIYRKKKGRMEGGRERHTGSLIKIKRQDRATRSYRDPRQSSPISERFFFSLFSVFNVRSWLRNWLFHVWRISWRQIQVRIISVRLHFPSLFFFFSFFKYRKLSISEFSIRQIFRFFFDLQRDIVVTVFLVEFVKLYTGLFNATR